MRLPSDADGHGTLDTCTVAGTRRFRLDRYGFPIGLHRDSINSFFHKTSKRKKQKNLFAMQRAGAAMAYAATRRMKKPSAHHSGGTGSFEIMMNWKCPSAFSEKKAAL